MRSILRRLRRKKREEPPPPPARGKPSKGKEPPREAPRRGARPPSAVRRGPDGRPRARPAPAPPPPAEPPEGEGELGSSAPTVPSVPAPAGALMAPPLAPPEAPEDAIAAMTDHCFVCGTRLNGSYCPTCRMTWVE